jgi:cell division septation protein DedD
LKSTAPNIHKESASWTLSWQPDGRCDSFTREAILANAPPTSGVYGLFNFDCQVFIGESANIQEALLRHERETDFQSRHLQPTGFTFEPCAVELCRPKVDELIARFHPVLQSEPALTETWSLSNGPMVSEVGAGSKELETYADHQEFPVHEHEKHPKIRRRFHFFKRTQGAALAAIFVASAVVIFYLSVPADYDIQKRANGANPTSGQTEIGLRPQSVSSIDKAGGLVNQSVETRPAKPDVRASASTPNDTARFAAKSASAADRAGVQAKTSPVAHSAESANLSKKWSVQISAAPARDIADTLVQRLKDKGYDGYVVQAEVKGQTYYRVRVGHFAAREEAESVRQSLARQEGYRDPYLTGD